MSSAELNSGTLHARLGEAEGLLFCLAALCASESASPLLSCHWVLKNVCRAKAEHRTGTTSFHATMLVTRAEEWWVQAESLRKRKRCWRPGKAIDILSVSWSTSSSTPSS